MVLSEISAGSTTPRHMSLVRDRVRLRVRVRVWVRLRLRLRLRMRAGWR